MTIAAKIAVATATAMAVIAPPGRVWVVEQEGEGKKHSPRDGRDPRYGTPAARGQPPRGEQQKEEGREG